MPLIGTECEGKLTEKQQQALRTKEKIIRAFYDENEKKHRSWSELKSLTKLSSGALSKHLRELVSQGVVKRKIIINEKNSMREVYEYTEKFLVVRGKQPQAVETDVLRVFHIDKKTSIAQWGYTKKARKRKPQTTSKKEEREKKPFHPTSEIFEI
ncbi:MAG: hypothetical protein ABSG57_04250 [Candidatus Bathyarchaeia archaeon]